MIHETKALALLKRAEYERSSGNLLLNTATWPSTASPCTFSVGDFSGSILGTLRNDYRELWLFPLDKLQLNLFSSCFRTVNKYTALTWSFICTHFLPLKLSYDFLDPLPYLSSFQNAVASVSLGVIVVFSFYPVYHTALIMF